MSTEAQVHAALNNAAANGFVLLLGVPAGPRLWDVAQELGIHDAALDVEDPEALFPHIESWPGWDPRLFRLREIRAELRGIDDREVALYAERLALFRELRAEDPPVAQKVIGAAAGVTDTAVKVAMDKADRLEAEKAASA